MTDIITLHEAIDLVIARIERGWTRGYYEHNGCMCLSGAIMSSIPERYYNALNISPRTSLRNQILLRIESNSIPYWNDYIAKDKQEVLDLLNQIKKETKNATFKRERPVVN